MRLEVAGRSPRVPTRRRSSVSRAAGARAAVAPPRSPPARSVTAVRRPRAAFTAELAVSPKAAAARGRSPRARARPRAGVAERPAGATTRSRSSPARSTTRSCSRPSRRGLRRLLRRGGLRGIRRRLERVVGCRRRQRDGVRRGPWRGARRTVFALARTVFALAVCPRKLTAAAADGGRSARRRGRIRDARATQPQKRSVALARLQRPHDARVTPTPPRNGKGVLCAGCGGSGVARPREGLDEVLELACRPALDTRCSSGS